MKRISTHLWFDKEAKEAAAFYVATFDASVIKSTATIHNTPSGDCDIVNISLAGSEYTLISAGPYFSFTPAVSFLVACDTTEEVDALWGTLREGGSELMGLGEYPFSKRYGWCTDRYGLSWQIMHRGVLEIKQKITPTMMFVGTVAGRAEEAMNFYTSIFPDSSVTVNMRYAVDEQPDIAGSIKHASFALLNREFAAMDSAHDHNFTFNEAISFVVHCDTQEEIDKYWEALSAEPKAEQCGWLKDKFGFSWQITPNIMDDMMTDPDPIRLVRVTQAFLKMKKFDIATLKAAYEG